MLDNRIKISDTRKFSHLVVKDDMASFETGVVHNVCSTFSLAKFIEWTSRIFVIDIKNDDEEGIGTMLQIKHISPAFLGNELNFEATVVSIENNELLCDVIVTTGSRKIAHAKTGQKLLKKDRINEIFSSLGPNT